MSQACHRFWTCDKTLTFLLIFKKVHNPLCLPRESTSEPWKVARTCGVLYILLRATTAYTFWTSQLPKVVRTWCSLYILTSKWRALFRHRNFQKWSEPGDFCTCWLRHELCAATVCTFSTAQLLKVLRSWSVLYILTWKCASRHNGVQFFISHLASWLRTRRFSEPTFRPSGATNHWKNSVSRLSYLFARLDLLSSASLIFSLLLFSSLWLFPSLLFICPYCRKFDF